VSGKVYLGNNTGKATVTAKAVPERDAWVSSDNILVLAETVTSTSDSTGAFFFDLIRSSEYERVIKYKITITYNNRVAFSRIVTVPSQSTANLEDLVR
jgi:hypothetical protein